jgi:hypothetical protein
MYCLIQFYIQLKDDLAPHRPFLKVLCIKLVIFFCFWQSWIISLLTADGGPLKPTDKIGGPDLRIGIPSMMTCVEMAIFAVLHLFAFPWKPYDLGRQHEQLPQGGEALPPEAHKAYAHGPALALMDSLNPWDIIKACLRGFRWLFVGVRHRKNDPSYQTKLEPMSNKDTGYHGPTFAGNGEAAFETTKPGKGQGGFEESDTSALLSHAQTSPYTNQNPDSLPAAPEPGQGYGVVPTTAEQHQRTNFEPQQTAYHRPPRGSDYGQSEEEDLGRRVNDWDMFGGATGGKPPLR